MNELIFIQQRLFGCGYSRDTGPEVKPIERVANMDYKATDAAREIQLPERIREALEARQRHREANRGRHDYATGQVVGIKHGGYGPLEESTPISILLSEKLGSDRWRGWVVTPDAEYAADRDLLVQECDGVAPDPSVRIIQCWNPVTVTAKMLGSIVQVIDPAQLAAARALAELGGETGCPKGAPGVMQWRNLQGVSMLTGSSPSGEGDIRVKYQNAYATAAWYVNECAERQRETASGKAALAGLASQLKDFGHALAARWPLAPRMEAPAPMALDYDYGAALNVCFSPAGDSALALTISPQCGAHPLATVSEDGQCLWKGALTKPVELPLQPGHAYRVALDGESISTAPPLSFHL